LTIDRRVLYTVGMENKEDTIRIVITVPVHVHAALMRQAGRRGASMSGLIRAVMGEWLQGQGEPVDWVVTWGGRRRRSASDDAPPDA
jgi:hypothetical protein